jgi:hypothetical protein
MIAEAMATASIRRSSAIDFSLAGRNALAKTSIRGEGFVNRQSVQNGQFPTCPALPKVRTARSARGILAE